MTALHWAAELGNQDMAALLLAAGANPLSETRIGRYTPMHVAAKGGHAAVIRRLVDAKADVNALTTTGASPLHFAAAAGSGESIAILLDAGAGVNAREPQWGQTPLMFAAGSGRTEAVKLLLARGADARATGKVVDLSARNREDAAESRVRNARVAADPEGPGRRTGRQPVRGGAGGSARGARRRQWQRTRTAGVCRIGRRAGRVDGAPADGP